jgi:hypothetical protein
LILVPEDAARLPAGEPGELPKPKRPATGRVPASDIIEVTALRARLVELEARAADLRADLERERAEVERERRERLAERDRAEKLAADVAALARRLAAIAEDATARDRDRARASWWRRTLLQIAGA